MARSGKGDTIVQNLPIDAGNSVNADGIIVVASAAPASTPGTVNTAQYGPDNADGEAVTTTNLDELVKNRNYVYNGATWDRQRGINGASKVDPTPSGTYPNAPTNVASANADTALLAANANRRGCIISNDSTAKLYVLLDQLGSGVASATNFSYVIPAGATLELPVPVFVGRIRGFWSAANGSAGVTDIT